MATTPTSNQNAVRTLAPENPDDRFQRSCNGIDCRSVRP
jgi:hypothetical protein